MPTGENKKILLVGYENKAYLSKTRIKDHTSSKSQFYVTQVTILHNAKIYIRIGPKLYFYPF